MWKVTVVQPVTEGFGFNITTEANVQLISFAYKTGQKPRRLPPADATSTESRNGLITLSILAETSCEFSLVTKGPYLISRAARAPTHRAQ
jgi:hypothetical protein